MAQTGTKSNWKGGKHNFYDNAINTTFPTGVWADCPLSAIANDPTVAYVFFEDFMNWKGVAIATTAMAGWTVTQDTAGAVSTSDTAQGGVLLIDCDSTTVTQGINLQYTEGTLPFIPVAGQDIWFECRLAVDEALTCEFFAGLSNADTNILDTSAMASENCIGWQCVTDDGVLLFAAEKATEGATKASTTLVEDTYVRLGFHVKGVTSIDHYVNGVKQSTSHVTANIPIVGLTPSFVCQSDGTQDPIIHLDWVKCVQIRA